MSCGRKVEAFPLDSDPRLDGLSRAQVRFPNPMLLEAANEFAGVQNSRAMNYLESELDLAR